MSELKPELQISVIHTEVYVPNKIAFQKRGMLGLSVAFILLVYELL